MLKKVALALILFPLFVGDAMARSVAGAWEGDLGGGVIIVLDVTTDGRWHGETVRDRQLISTREGTYERIESAADTGAIAFNPPLSVHHFESGVADDENNTYSLEEDGQVLRITTTQEAWNCIDCSSVRERSDGRWRLVPLH